MQLACAKLSDCIDIIPDPNVVSGPSNCNGIALVTESYPMCFKIGTSWVHNISSTIPDVPSAEECQSFCLQSPECIAFTWHRVSEDFGSKLCELFPAIGDSSDECPDCISGPKSCTCSDSVACSFDGQYLIDILTEVATEEQCQDLCARDTNCTWYTWYSSEGWPFSLACALLSECSDSKVVPDGSVWSGLADCSNLPAGCTNYNVLDSHSRNYRVTETNFCGHNDYCCDRPGYSYSSPDWKGHGWYRITGEAGTRILDSPVDHYHCGTAVTGWLSGEHPSPGEGAVTRKVCFNYGGDDCAYEVDIDVLNCDNAYFVYYLKDVPKCWLGYCTE